MQNQRIHYYSQGNLLWAIDNKTVGRYGIQFVYICSIPINKQFIRKGTPILKLAKVKRLKVKKIIKKFVIGY